MCRATTGISSERRSFATPSRTWAFACPALVFSAFHVLTNTTPRSFPGKMSTLSRTGRCGLPPEKAYGGRADRDTGGAASQRSGFQLHGRCAHIQGGALPPGALIRPRARRTCSRPGHGNTPTEST
jgi:hypothetical protein